ncbi:MAG: hypothetical protein ABH879_06900 [archaeon]
MGAHPYNTSANFSSRAGGIVEEPPIFLGVPYPRYSDIFVMKENPGQLVTRPGSCYWLWKAGPSQR